MIDMGIQGGIGDAFLFDDASMAIDRIMREREEQKALDDFVKRIRILSSLPCVPCGQRRGGV